MYALFPLSRPLGCLLDCILGGEHTPRRFRDDELNYIIKTHAVKALEKGGGNFTDFSDENSKLTEMVRP